MSGPVQNSLYTSSMPTARAPCPCRSCAGGPRSRGSPPPAPPACRRCETCGRMPSPRRAAVPEGSGGGTPRMPAAAPSGGSASSSSILASLLVTMAASPSTSAAWSALARAISSACSALSEANLALREAIVESFASKSLRARTIALRSSVFSAVSLAISSRRMAGSGLGTIPAPPGAAINCASPDFRCGFCAYAPRRRPRGRPD